MSTTDQPIVLAMSGASGAAYGVRLLEVLLAAERLVHLTISPSFAAVYEQELGTPLDLASFDVLGMLIGFAEWRERVAGQGNSLKVKLSHDQLARVTYAPHLDLMQPIASGSFLTAGMVVCPCSGSTMAAIAHAQGTNLLHRAAEVHLKERRKLILVPRETPLSLPQLENMRAATLAGAVILPASPGFYHGAASMMDLVDFVVARICDQLAVPHNLMRRWGETIIDN
jgi:4-hydroxy-3-polyprenylbenzoate decarboxylase